MTDTARPAQGSGRYRSFSPSTCHDMGPQGCALFNFVQSYADLHVREV